MDKFSVLLRNGNIYIGDGSPGFRGDIGISNGRIAAVGDLKDVEATKEVDVEGLSVCPGFIDIHSHFDANIFVIPQAESKVLQGITTDLSGNCGYSNYPVKPETQIQLRDWLGKADVSMDWTDLGGFIDKLNSIKVSINYSTLIGLGSLRSYVMGDEDRPPTENELNRMKDEIRKAMNQGAMGISTGLIYAPGFFATTDEIIELAKAAAEFDGIYASHIRGEAREVMDAVAEAIEIGRQSGISVQISHLKVSGKRNWGQAEKILEMIESAQKEGLNVDFDRYPYIASSTSLSSVFPAWVHDGGDAEMITRLKNVDLRKRVKEETEKLMYWESDWDMIQISDVRSDKNKWMVGKRVSEIAEKLGADPFHVACDLLIDESNAVSCVFFSMCDEDTDRILKHPGCMIGSDSTGRADYGQLSEGQPHPRAFGTFPRVIGHYVRKRGLLEMSDAIKRMTSMPANKLNLHDRGMVKENFAADLIVFDEERIGDTATFDRPICYPEGISIVLVNGMVTVEEGKHTGSRAGVFLPQKNNQS